MRSNRNFDMGSTTGELGHANRRSSRPRLFEIGDIDGVHAGELLHVGEVTVDAHGVIESEASFLQSHPHVF